jgi:hypothetical protein
VWSASAVYSKFEELEEQAASIYVRMAARFSAENPELSEFLLDMGMQEKQHAGLLQFCLAEELFASDLPGEKDTLDAVELFTILGRRASGPSLTVSDAFEIACELETCEVNAIYDRLTTPAHASAYLLRRKIASSLPDHVGELIRQARNFKVTEQALARMEALAARDRPK